MNTREVMQQALEALELGYDAAKAEADQYHAAMAGYRPQRHAKMDADAQKIAAAITALRAALAEPQSGWDKWQEQKRGCSVCGIGANGEVVGYVCTRNDCPTRVTCGDAP